MSLQILNIEVLASNTGSQVKRSLKMTIIMLFLADENTTDAMAQDEVVFDPTLLFVEACSIMLSPALAHLCSGAAVR